MKNDPLTLQQIGILDTEGAKLREMMKSEGWVVMARLFKTTLERYDSTHGLTTLKQMLARQDALAMMNAWMESVIQRVSNLEHKETVRREVHSRVERSGMVIMPEIEDEES